MGTSGPLPGAAGSHGDQRKPLHSPRFLCDMNARHYHIIDSLERAPYCLESSPYCKRAVCTYGAAGRVIRKAGPSDWVLCHGGLCSWVWLEMRSSPSPGSNPMWFPTGRGIGEQQQRGRGRSQLAEQQGREGQRAARWRAGGRAAAPQALQKARAAKQLMFPVHILVVYSKALCRRNCLYRTDL